MKYLSFVPKRDYSLLIYYSLTTLPYIANHHCSNNPLKKVTLGQHQTMSIMFEAFR